MSHLRIGTSFQAWFRFVLFCVLLVAAAYPSRAQTFTVIHAFTGGPDGGSPYTGLAIDRAGNLYGDTIYGGNTRGSNCANQGCGVVFKLKNSGRGWLLTPIYMFQGGSDGNQSCTTMKIAADGSLYGTTSAGGLDNCADGVSCLEPRTGCGIVFHLTPPAISQGGTLSSWTETVLHKFANSSDGAYPRGDLAFDAQGNLYGGARIGGSFNGGTIYQLIPAGSGWTLNVLHSFNPTIDGAAPLGGVLLDSTGSVYGTASSGGPQHSCGMAFQLQPTGSGWAVTILHWFGAQGDGCLPAGGLIFDPSGHLYGTADFTYDGMQVYGGEVFEFSYSDNQWQYSVINDLLNDHDGYGPQGTLLMDPAGNLYGTTWSGGAHNFGAVFKLTPTLGGWTYTSLHDFTNGNDGASPVSNVVEDAEGNLYGTAAQGGTYGQGVVWEVSP
jgi:uncharacterized repeat protein (TIGR03803 family)